MPFTSAKKPLSQLRKLYFQAVYDLWDQGATQILLCSDILHYALGDMLRDMSYDLFDDSDYGDGYGAGDGSSNGYHAPAGYPNDFDDPYNAANYVSATSHQGYFDYADALATLLLEADISKVFASKDEEAMISHPFYQHLFVRAGITHLVFVDADEFFPKNEMGESLTQKGFDSQSVCFTYRFRPSLFEIDSPTNPYYRLESKLFSLKNPSFNYLLNGWLPMVCGQSVHAMRAACEP